MAYYKKIKKISKNVITLLTFAKIFVIILVRMKNGYTKLRS